MTLRERIARIFFGDAIQQAVTQVETRLKAEADERVREAYGSVSRPDDAATLAAGYRAMTTGGRRTRPEIQLQPLAQDNMLRMVTYLRDSNPLAGWLLNTTVDFTLGEGFTVDAEDEKVKECLDTFVDDPVNQLDLRFDRWAMEFGMYGEFCLPMFTNPVDGYARLGYVDPYTIHEVLTDPNNVLVRTAVILKAPTGQKQKVLKVIREETWRSSPNYGLLMPAEEGERDTQLGVPYDGSCFLFQTNHVSNATRGRSDLLPLIDWLDGYDQFLFDSMDNANLFNSFVYDLTIEGGTEDMIKAHIAKITALKKGQIYGHNEKIKLADVTPDLKANDKQVFAQDLRGHIVGSQSFPEHWYGMGGNVNFASAKEMGLPPVKRLTRRQKELRYILEQMLTFALHQKVRVGDLSREIVVGQVDRAGSSTGTSVPVEKAFKVILPELSIRDSAGIVAALTSLTAALIQGKMEGWIRPATAAKVFALQVSQLGLEVDAKVEFDPNAVPQGMSGQDYSAANTQQILARLDAQLGRTANGNGDNINEPKKTTEVGGRVAETDPRIAEAISMLHHVLTRPQTPQNITVNTAPVTVEPAAVTVNAAPITVESPEVTVNPAAVTVNPPAVTVEAPVVNVTVPEHKQVATLDTVTQRDEQGRVVTIERRPIEPADG